ncbi:MAG: hypothetical protein WCG42_08145, partial [Parachlamydiaceae bacterium]
MSGNITLGGSLDRFFKIADLSISVPDVREQSRDPRFTEMGIMCRQIIDNIRGAYQEQLATEITMLDEETSDILRHLGNLFCSIVKMDMEEIMARPLMEDRELTLSNRLQSNLPDLKRLSKEISTLSVEKNLVESLNRFSEIADSFIRVLEKQQGVDSNMIERIMDYRKTIRTTKIDYKAHLVTPINQLNEKIRKQL